MNTRHDLPLSLDLLRGFETAARLLSFTRAATELFVTQSAVSRQVQQLEEQLGVKLFERRTRALALTEAGVGLLKDAAARPELTLARQRRVSKERDRRPSRPRPDTDAWKDVDHDLFDRLRAVVLMIVV